MNTKILATVATAGAIFASAQLSAQELEFSATAGFESEYVFRGVEIASESFQGSIDATFGDGYLGIWMNESFDDEDKGASEYDLYGGWGYAVNDTFTADFGATLYHYPDADDETFEVYVGASADVALAPSFYVYYDFDLETFTYEGSISKAFELNDKSSIELGGALGLVDPSEGEGYAYYSVTADYVYSIADNMSASIGVRAAGNDSNVGPGGKEHNAWAGTSFSYSF